jgi:hypothetical protein
VIYHEKRPKKLKTRETKYVEINNIVCMELYSGAKMVNERDLKTKYLRSKNREFTVLTSLLKVSVDKLAIGGISSISEVHDHEDHGSRGKENIRAHMTLHLC